MTRLAARRFPDIITRRRESPGRRNERGRYERGVVVETELRASVQPLSLEDQDLPEGTRVHDRLKVFVPEPDALIAAFEDAGADQVSLDGVVYTVEESRSWRGSHTRATLLRQAKS